MTQISTDDRHASSEDFSLNCQSKKSLRVFSSWLLFVLILQQLQWKPRGFSLSFHEKTINDHQSILRGIFCCFFALSEIVCRNEGKAVLIKRNEESKQTWNQSTMTLLLESRMLLSPFLSLLSSCAAKTSLSRRRDTLFHVSTEIREMVTDSSNEREWKSNRVCFFHAIHFKRDARQRLSSMSLFSETMVRRMRRRLKETSRLRHRLQRVRAFHPKKESIKAISFHRVQYSV